MFWAKGRPLPQNDIGIAAIATHRDLVLARIAGISAKLTIDYRCVVRRFLWSPE
jgi:predicted nucleic acid-binding protein